MLSGTACGLLLLLLLEVLAVDLAMNVGKLVTPGEKHVLYC